MGRQGERGGLKILKNEETSLMDDPLPKLPIHELVILLKYQLDWKKIVDFLLSAYF